jgi:tetratricopeptide (TPR) repeat protein
MHRSLKHLLSNSLLAGAVALGVGGLAAPTQADSFSHYEPAFLRQADRALWHDDAERALEIIAANQDRQFKRHDRAEAYGLICRAQLKRDDAIAAREACLAALDLSQSRDSWRFLNNLGVAELTLGNYEAAEEAFARAAALSGWSAAPRRNLQLIGEFREAREGATGERIAAEVR